MIINIFIFFSIDVTHKKGKKIRYKLNYSLRISGYYSIGCVSTYLFASYTIIDINTIYYNHITADLITNLNYNRYLI